MCRNITTLRGLEPAATSEEIEAAARQYVRKVSGVQATSARTEAAFERAVSKGEVRTYRALGYRFQVSSSTGVVDEQLYRHLRPFLDYGDPSPGLPLSTA